MTVKVNISGIDELDFPSGVSSATVSDGVATVNLASSGGTVTNIGTAGIATGGPITSTGTITVLGSGNTTTAATAASSVASAPTGDVITADGSGNVKDSGTLLSSLAPKASPALTGVPTAPTAAAATNTTQLATTAFVESEIPLRSAVTSVFTRTGAVVAATGDYTQSQISAGAIANSTTATTQAALSNDTKVATDAYVDSAVGVEKTRALAAEALLAPLASPALTGTPTAPTKTALTNNTDIATTAYTDAAVAAQAAVTPVISGNGGFWGQTFQFPASTIANAGDITANNKIRLKRFTIPCNVTCTGVAIDITTAVSSSTVVMDVGLYTAAGVFVLNSHGSTGGGSGLSFTTTGVLHATFTKVAIPAGDYYLAFTGAVTVGSGAITAVGYQALNESVQISMSSAITGASLAWTTTSSATAGILPTGTLTGLATETADDYAPVVFFAY